MPGAPDFVDLRRDAATGVEAIRARFSGKAYDLHRHDEWLVGVTDHGVQDFFCRGLRRRSITGRVILIEPQEAHDGEAGRGANQGAGEEIGFSYRMLYLPQGWLRTALEDRPGPQPGFRASLSDDRGLGQAIRAAVAALAIPGDRLGRDGALDRVVAHLRPHLGATARLEGTGDAPAAARARDILNASLTRDLGADALAREAGAPDRFHLARAFRARYGASPHAYRVQVRLMAARRSLARGHAPADVATSCGFADQSHLGRWFRRAYGLTPAAYRSACTGVPDRQTPTT